LKKCDHIIGIKKKPHFRQNLGKSAENCDHNIEPRSEAKTTLDNTYVQSRLSALVRPLAIDSTQRDFRNNDLSNILAPGCLKAEEPWCHKINLVLTIDFIV
jgi:hypothetical protein